MRKNKRCPICEQGTVSPIATRERMPYRHVTALEPAWDVRVPTCNHCHERFIDAATARALDEALEAALQSLQTRLVDEAISRLGTAKTQRQWEKQLGLSPGYLSRLKTGKESSVVLTTLLSLLSQAPAQQWKQVERIWSGDHAEGSDVLAFPHQGSTIATTLHVRQESSSQTVSVSRFQLREVKCTEAEFTMEAA